jgi:hypothetical protein
MLFFTYSYFKSLYSLCYIVGLAFLVILGSFCVDKDILKVRAVPPCNLWLSTPTHLPDFAGIKDSYDTESH